jgi:hypothetical protein
MVGWLMTAALAGTSTHVVVEGQTIAVHHGEYCSYPRVAGVTTETSGPLPERPLDVVFDPAFLTKSFTGLVRMDDESPVGALALPVEADLRMPSPDPAAWQEVLGPCRIHTLEGASLPELLRRLGPEARSVVVRTLATAGVTTTTCGASLRASVVEAALPCGEGRCDAFVEIVGRLHTATCR